MQSTVTMEKLVALAKQRGFVFPGSDIYGGMAHSWDYGPLGTELKRTYECLRHGLSPRVEIWSA